MGETATGFLVLQARADSDIKVIQIETDSPDVTVEAVPADGSPTGKGFRVKQRVDKEGDQSTVARFVLTKKGRPVSASVVISYRGEVQTPRNNPSK